MKKLELSSEVLSYYRSGAESQRLLHGMGLLEFVRTKEIISRYLPHPPATVYDVGGGPGLYACWLAQLGYEVHLVDATDAHIEQAHEASRCQSERPLASCSVGDARSLSCKSNAVDAVLLLGPLYHLIAREDRIQALAEAYRILKPDGVLIAAGISRFASALEGLRAGALQDPDFAAIVWADLRDGQHRNATSKDYFTTAYFHKPREFKGEVEEADFLKCTLLAVEGPAWLFQDLDQQWQDQKRRETLLAIVRELEGEESLMGASAHFVAVGVKGK